MTQQHIILPYKRRVDIHGINPPFDQLLQPGEEIIGGSCTVEIFTGTDPNPSEMLEGSTEVRGTTLYQKIKLGIPGVVYLLKFTAITDEGNSYTVEAKQAVIQDNIPAGPLYSYTFLTSPPYPIENIEGVELDNPTNSAIIWIPPRDGIDTLFTALDGTLEDVLIVYVWPPEDAVELSVTALDGTLVDVLLFYTMDPEGVDVTFSALDGTLVNALITYSNYPPEGVGLSVTPLNGTLT